MYIQIYRLEWLKTNVRQNENIKTLLLLQLLLPLLCMQLLLHDSIP